MSVFDSGSFQREQRSSSPWAFQFHPDSLHRLKCTLLFFSHALGKMIENHSGCIEWAEVSFRETAVWEVLVFPQVFRGFPSPLSAVNQHHRTADGRLCLAGAHILGAYRCPQRWGCQGRMPSKSAGEHYISHYLRTIGHFLLAAGQRGWSGAAKPQEGSTDCRRGWRLKGGELHEVDELLGRWFQSGCKLN